MNPKRLTIKLNKLIVNTDAVIEQRALQQALEHTITQQLRSKRVSTAPQQHNDMQRIAEYISSVLVSAIKD